MEQGYLQQLESYAENLLTSAAGADEETEATIKAEIALINSFTNLIREGSYEVYQSDVISRALEKSKENILAYCHKIQELIENFKQDIARYSNQDGLLHEQNLEINRKRNEKETELYNMGFFDRARKKQLQAEIDRLQPIKAPYDFNEKKAEIQKKIDFLNGNIEPLQDKLKGLYYCQDKAYMYFASMERQQKQSQAYTRQQAEPKKAPEAAREPEKLKGLKEVHKPNLKPLKRL